MTTVQYSPDTWTDNQRAAHRAETLEAAFHAATCLAGGWYRRAVTIDFKTTADNDEQYMLRPSEVPTVAGWTPCYTVIAAFTDGG